MRKDPEIPTALADGIDGLLSGSWPTGCAPRIVPSLEWAIPAVNQYVKKLRERFPDINLAVVTHGKEQFGLQLSFPGKKEKEI